ncbi:hypothetical protein HBI56_142010 [Parastagonospora nodorum]|uniref:Amine oxidase domain-containing protein n=2 Tax=Phaeosphaeria nodorum (strain SN15 / ATCC MYA-4574 / FGSC 10173) TaxID=321614 RepID=A0A7U2F7L3_PHANO|nr:hypothetical protein SNOG_07023 [Parastagonospora nodorum SN15]KAH3918335.1 hypothetical protein HBH56_035070 [Parastagonospora nodorum]EAT85674.1 hypothetical protein SNOG_07023 [Parastagonospora nodorum SN15]KAH3933648.1 hypothetical protein HBH54_064390 [Parastagonospora nodorum]KAH3952597.1 hypothetical protein HBH53_045700 [Parastagonospora nodorum]KAH4002005.1 hypothetical protein HBI10_081360 [Parastagonospora nodorum]
MWSLPIAALALLSHMIEAFPTRRHEEHKPVCIIGAGPAGLSAAGRLEQKGVKAIIFDEQEEVGGKCQSWYDDKGIFHPLGAAFLSNASYTETLKVLSQTDVSLEPFALAGARQMFRYNFTDAFIDANPAPSSQFFATVAAEIPRYASLWNQRFAPISATNYKNGVPQELTVSGSEWFRMNNFTALPLLLVNPVALYGYGDINIVPALYILQYFTPDILTAFVGLHEVYYTDFHKIFVEYTKKALCKTTIKTSAEVRCVDRSGHRPIITYTQPSGNYVSYHKQECSSVIFAFPPSIASLERAGVDLSEEEYDTFRNVTTHQYYSSAVELEMPFSVSYIANSTNAAVPPPNLGEPVAVLRLSQQSNVSVAWSWGPYEYQTEKAGRDLLIKSMSALNKDPRNATKPAAPFGENNIKAFKKWDYFPHFGTDALRSGAYASLNKLQGCKKSYWASGLSGMEIVEWAIRGGHEVVDTYF